MDGRRRRRAQGPQQEMLRRQMEAEQANKQAEPLREPPKAEQSERRRRRPQPTEAHSSAEAGNSGMNRAAEPARAKRMRARHRRPLPARLRLSGRRAWKTIKAKSRRARRTGKRALWTIGNWLSLLVVGLAVLVSCVWRLACAAADGAGRLVRRLVCAFGRTPKDRLRSAVSLGLACVAVFSACMAGSIVIRTIRTRRLNQALSAQFSAYEGDVWTQETGDTADDGQTPVVTPSPSAEPLDEATPVPADAEPTKAPPIVKSTVFHQVGGDALPNMEALYDQNRDLIAWLNIPDVIDLPVVYRDNDYYLKRDFYKQANDAGTIFLDEHHPFREKTQNLLLHGHNMKDGTMFGRLTQYLTDNTYIKNHPFINFSTLWRQEQYVIFAVLDVSLDPASEDFFNYFSYSTFNSDEEFSFFVRELQLRSEYAIPIDVQPSDALVMLSTCLEEDRLVIAARRIRQGETRSELRQAVHMAVRQ